jgi:hypothetical protein
MHPPTELRQAEDRFDVAPAGIRRRRTTASSRMAARIARVCSEDDDKDIAGDLSVRAPGVLSLRLVVPARR